MRLALALPSKAISARRLAAAFHLVADALSSRAALAEVGLSHREAHFPGQLSGGEQQRVALARALAPRPALILADEPTGNLDLATGAQVMDFLFELKARSGATLLLITHDRSLAKRCDRIVSLADGRIVSAGAKRKVAAS